MKTTKYLFGVGILITGMLTTACQDDLAGPSRYDDGKLHFNLTTNEQWGEDGPTTRMLPSIVMNRPDFMSDTLYLHCEESNTIGDPFATDSDASLRTRGQRLTGEVFRYPDGGIKSFGIYAKVGSDVVLPYTTKVERDAQLSQDKDEEDWYIKDQQELNFPGENNSWTTDKKGHFYGFAPFPGDAADEASCISVATVNDVPTLTFTMQPDEKDNKDILTAKATDLASTAKTDGVKLSFRHVLAAVKFKFSDANISAKVDDTDYYMQITDIRLEGIYAQGSCPIGEAVPTGTDDETVIAAMSYWKNDGSTGDCSISALRSRDEIANDANHLMNTDEHCFMVLPQQPPTGAQLVVTCNLTTDREGNNIYKSNVTLSAALNTKKWRPGYSYTYTLSKNAFVTNGELTSKVENENGKAMQFNAEGKAYDNGTLGSNLFKAFTVKSARKVYKADGTFQREEAMPWHLEYQEFIYTNDDPGDVTGEWGEWHSGTLPYGYYLKDPDGNIIRNLSAIGGTSTSEITYKLYAGKNTAYPSDGERDKSVFVLRGKHYEANTSDGYYDLSYDYDASNRNTANCYMIDGYGKFKLPLVYGNGIRDGRENHAAFSERTLYPAFINYKANHITSPYIKNDISTNQPAAAEVVWEDEFGLIDNLAYDDTENGYLKFEIRKDNIRSGNAIIAVKDNNGDIMWSWHIWVTVLKYTVKDQVNGEGYIYHSGQNNYLNVTKYNLGWHDEETITTVKNLKLRIRVVQNATGRTVSHDVTQDAGVVTFGASNLYYQYGRKDPMPAAVVGEDFAERLHSYGYEWEEEDNTGVDMSAAIQHPNKVYVHRMPKPNSTSSTNPYTNTNWCCVPGTNVTPIGGGTEWNTEPNYELQKNKSFDLYKTIYDPCPVGYTVPPLAFAYIFNTAAGGNFVKDDGALPCLVGAEGTAVADFKFPLAGYRDRHGQITNFPQMGRYWTAGHTTVGTSTHYDFYRSMDCYSGGSITNKEDETSIAMSIRPVAEKRSFENKPAAPTADFTINLHNSGSNERQIGKNQMGYGSNLAGFTDWSGVSAMVFDYYNINPEDFDITLHFNAGCFTNDGSLDKYSLNVSMNNQTYTISKKTGSSSTPKALNNSGAGVEVLSTTPSTFGFANNTDFLNWIRNHPKAIFTTSCTGSANDVRVSRAYIEFKHK